MTAEPPGVRGDDMIDLQIQERLPSPIDYNALRSAVGWGVVEEGAAAISLPRSLYGVCAYHGGRIIAMARVVGDGGLVFYIQDVIVLPAFQRQGIGSLLMDKVMEHIGAHASDNTFVGLMAARDREGFYERLGFVRRPNSLFGSGMSMVLKRGG
jgi:ribosomal protein S18 acetylase RimI-like enzyme